MRTAEQFTLHDAVRVIDRFETEITIWNVEIARHYSCKKNEILLVLSNDVVFDRRGFAENVPIRELIILTKTGLGVLSYSSDSVFNRQIEQFLIKL